MLCCPQAAAFECFQTVAARHTQAVQTDRGMELQQFSERNRLDVRGKLPRDLIMKNLFSLAVAEANDHAAIVP